MATMLLIIFLEIIVRLLHETSNLTAKEHFCEDVAAVVEVLGSGSISYCQRDGRACCQRILHRDMNGVERFVAVLDVAKIHVRIHDIPFVTNETKSVAIDASMSIIDGYLRHSRWK